MSKAFKYSVLDLAPVRQHSTVSDSFQESVGLAQLCEQLGYTRFWLAEHHGMKGIASAATSVLISHIAHHTSTIRVGAGGIMLPNHSPLVIAEQFGTLEALFPKRIDLGLGRAPGSDQATARALRRHLNQDPNEFPADVLELLDYLSAQPQGKIIATPGVGSEVPVWILGSSLFGAQLAAHLGLPYAFASHFAPAQLHEAVQFYRQHFQPSTYLAKPYVMLGVNVFAADSTAQAELLASSWQQSFVSLRTGQPIQLPPPVPNYYQSLAPAAKKLIDHLHTCTAIGDEATVAQELDDFLSLTRADELMITTNIYEPEARLRSYEITARALNAL